MSKHSAQGVAIKRRAQVKLDGFMSWVDKTIDKMIKFDYTKLIPEGRISEKYDYFRVFSAEFTLRYCGPGLGVAVGKRDIWIGWPPDRI